jgi:hypothetical protein
MLAAERQQDTVLRASARDIQNILFWSIRCGDTNKEPHRIAGTIYKILEKVRLNLISTLIDR